ncbi:hypothetical protein ACIGZJ_17990 [Kitasatospora sp. NPDC052868]|uniref:hypothetical protein n=1 Tax=Kitasatospora sp. NPDC052868 TaxID=3364060 RepID=UPI0037C73CFB
MITAAAAVAVLAPVLVMTAGAQANAAAPTSKPTVVDLPLDITVDQPVGVLQLSKYDQCVAAYNVNYWAGGAAFARGQWYACMA